MKALAVTVGFEQRVRNEDWNNILDFDGGLDDSNQQIRYRTRAWLGLNAGHGISTFVSLTQETNQKLGRDNRFDEIIIDNAYVNFSHLLVPGLSLRVGRQNLSRGEGLILMEGTAGDGSRTVYFNGFDLSYQRAKSTIELLGISDPATDQYLPRLNDRGRSLQEWDERALGVYYTDRNLEPVTIESYYFYKKELHDSRLPSSPQYQPDRNLHTVGGRVTRPFGKRWLLAAEGAFQRGDQKDGKSVRAHAGYAHVKRTFDRKLKPYLLGGFVGLSGDDPRTKNVVENWDPLFSRWPKWSELYIYTQMKEVGCSYWTNLSMSQVEAGFATAKRISARATWYHMLAPQPFAGDPALYATGGTRGDLIQGRVDFVLNKYLKGHALYERMLPGSYYASRDPGYFLRFEMIFSAETAVPIIHSAADRLGLH